MGLFDSENEIIDYNGEKISVPKGIPESDLYSIFNTIDAEKAPSQVVPQSEPTDFFSAIQTAEGTNKDGRDPYQTTLGYDAYGAPPKPLTDMTLQEVHDFGRQILNHPNNKLNSSAVGAYQIVGNTLFSRDRNGQDTYKMIKDLGYDLNTKFTPEVQDRMAAYIAQEQGSNAWEGFKVHPELRKIADSAIQSGNFERNPSSLMGKGLLAGPGATDPIDALPPESPALEKSSYKGVDFMLPADASEAEITSALDAIDADLIASRPPLERPQSDSLVNAKVDPMRPQEVPVEQTPRDKGSILSLLNPANYAKSIGGSIINAGSAAIENVQKSPLNTALFGPAATAIAGNFLPDNSLSSLLGSVNGHDEMVAKEQGQMVSERDPRSPDLVDKIKTQEDITKVVGEQFTSALRNVADEMKASTPEIMDKGIASVATDAGWISKPENAGILRGIYNNADAFFSPSGVANLIALGASGPAGLALITPEISQSVQSQLAIIDDPNSKLGDKTEAATNAAIQLIPFALSALPKFGGEAGVNMTEVGVKNLPSATSGAPSLLSTLFGKKPTEEILDPNAIGQKFQASQPKQSFLNIPSEVAPEPIATPSEVTPTVVPEALKTPVEKILKPRKPRGKNRENVLVTVDGQPIVYHGKLELVDSFKKDLLAKQQVDPNGVSLIKDLKVKKTEPARDTTVDEITSYMDALKKDDGSIQMKIAPEANMAKPEDLPSVFNQKDGVISYNKEAAITQAKSMGYDGIDIPKFEAKTTAPKESAIEVFNQKVLSPMEIPKATLTDTLVPRETKVRQVAKGVETRAIENNLVESFKDLPEYSTMNMKDQAAKASELYNIDPERATRIAMGKEPSPEGLTPEMVFKVAEKNALLKGDVETLRSLATESSLVKEATEMGQRLASLAERDPTSPVKAIQEVMKAREEALVKKSGEKISGEQLKAKEMKAIEEHIQKSLPTVDDVAKLLKDIRC